MAKKWTNRNLPGVLHFVTGNVLDRKPIFRHEKYCRAFLEELQELRIKRQCKIIAFVLMTDHFHFIGNPKDDDIQTATGILKSFTAKRIVSLAPSRAFLRNGENQVWQESFKSLALWSGWMIKQKIDYIHANPVKDDLCKTASEYPWTSFRSFYHGEPDPLFAIDKEWWWEGDEAKLTASVKQVEEKKREALAEKIEDNRKKATDHYKTRFDCI